MLSRVADSLYWMSRYLERAENTIRQLDVTMSLMLDTSETSADTRWQRLLVSLGNPPGVEWNGDIERIELVGPFAVGGTIVMTPIGQEPIELRIAEAHTHPAAQRLVADDERQPHSDESDPRTEECIEPTEISQARRRDSKKCAADRDCVGKVHVLRVDERTVVNWVRLRVVISQPIQHRAATAQTDESRLLRGEIWSNVILDRVEQGLDKRHRLTCPRICSHR